MITIIRNQRLLLASTLLLSIGLPVQAGTSTAKSITEEPPPWSAQASRVSRHAAPAPVAVPVRRAVAATKGAGIEGWYQARNAKLKSASGELDALRARASQGDSNAQYELGMLYQGAGGVYQDAAQAREWLLKSANAGNLRAQYALALLLRDSGSPADIQQSLQWQETSARAGHVEAQYGLGVLYTNGQYVQASAEVAQFWLQQAAKRGHEGAKIALVSAPPAVMTSRSAPEQRMESAPVQQVQARRVLQPAPSAAVRAHQAPEPEAIAHATVDAALLPEQPEEPADISVEHNNSKVDLGKLTVDEVRDAAFKGDMKAQLMLGALYEDGSEGVEQNLETAATWYLKSARQGFPKAQYNLALLYEDGRGMKQDYGQAAFWYKKAAAAGFSEAQNNLAVLYLTGNGVPEDMKKAEELLMDAVAAGNANAERNLDMLREQMG